ncbi:hypothetical protein DMENIID0001_004190 [Sergentomyia squamirostris]
MVDLARKKMEFQKATNISKLPEGQYFHVLGMKLMQTRYGEVMLAKLPNGLSVWLPKGLVNDLDIDQLITITPEDNCELAYLGKAEIDIYLNVKCKSPDECASMGIKKYLISCRLTQTYDAGACIYFYFGFNSAGITNPTQVYEEIESKARDEILNSGGTISHHHGVGKLRKRWYPQTISSVGLSLFHAIKQELDPKNTFAVGNLVNLDSSLVKL